MRLGAKVACGSFAAALGSSCAGGADPETSGAIWFEDVAGRAGVDFQHVAARQRRFRFPEIMGAGLGFADVDDDGFLDLYCVQGGELGADLEAQPGDRLYHNRTDGTFEDVTRAAGLGDRGYGMGCAFGDCDEDGDVDLFVTNLGPDVLYQNQGDGTFADVSARAGVADPRWGTSAAFFDHENDGDLDLFVVNYVNWSEEREIHCSSAYSARDYCSPNNYNAPATAGLYRNDGDLAFTDVAERAGLTRASGNGLGVVCGDFDDDGRIDVYVANDQLPNHLWIAQEDGTFGERALIAGCAVDHDGVARAGMGVVSPDHQDDGDLDLFVTNLRSETNIFYLNDRGVFVDHTALAGLAAPSYAFTGFGVGFADFDHDGQRDLYVANGGVTIGRRFYKPGDPFAEPNQLLRGLPTDTFEEVPHVGLASPAAENSRGLALGDYDNDGDVDVAILNNGSRVELLENVRAAKGHWLVIRALNERGRDDLGALVGIGTEPERQWRAVQTAYSYCSSSDPRVHFGLGSDARPVEVEIRWLDGTRERFGPLAADTLHTVRKGTGEPLEQTPRSPPR